MTGLPPQFAYWLQRRLSSSGQGVEVERKYLLRHLDNWRANPDRILPLPGYLSPPPNAPGKPYPEGWSSSNFHHHANARRKRQRAGLTH